MTTLEEIWEATLRYEGEGAKSFETPFGRVQLYKGAMEIPLAAFFLKTPAVLGAEQMSGFAAILGSMGLELDCVEEGRNFKINKSDTKLYMGRITCDSLKLHAPRIKDIGADAFYKIVNFWKTAFACQEQSHG